MAMGWRWFKVSKAFKKMVLRQISLAFAALLAGALTAQAKVDITVDKNQQQMTVAVDGVAKYNWPVSSGNPSHETPSGNFRAFRMELDHYSKEFDDAPMPHAIFFTKTGHAIHGTDSVSRLGSPASHGCVRLSRANAATLYALVKSEVVLNTTVTLSGSSQIALARNPKAPRQARRIAPSDDEIAETSRPVYGMTDPQGGSWPRGYRQPYAAPSYGVSGYDQSAYEQRGYARPLYAPQVYAPRAYYQRGYGYQD